MLRWWSSRGSFYHQYQFPHSLLIERCFEVLMFQIKKLPWKIEFHHQHAIRNNCQVLIWSNASFRLNSRDKTMIWWCKGARHVQETMILAFFFPVGTCQRPTDNGVCRHEPCERKMIWKSAMFLPCRSRCSWKITLKWLVLIENFCLVYVVLLVCPIWLLVIF